MHQLSFTDMEFELRRKTRKTRTERVTERLDELVPWGDPLDLIRPFYFESGHRGRQPFDLELMLRIHLLQISYNLVEKSRKSDWLFAETRTASFEVPWRPFFRLPFGLEGSWPTEMGRMGMP